MSVHSPPLERNLPSPCYSAAVLEASCPDDRGLAAACCRPQCATSATRRLVLGNAQPPPPAFPFLCRVGRRPMTLRGTLVRKGPVPPTGLVLARSSMPRSCCRIQPSATVGVSIADFPEFAMFPAQPRALEGSSMDLALRSLQRRGNRFRAPAGVVYE